MKEALTYDDVLLVPQYSDIRSREEVDVSTHLDDNLVLELAKTHDVLVTVEENVIAGGAGSAVNEFLQAQRILMPVLNLGLPDSFVEQGSREELLSLCGLDIEGILARIESFCA